MACISEQIFQVGCYQIFFTKLKLLQVYLIELYKHVSVDSCLFMLLPMRVVIDCQRPGEQVAEVDIDRDVILSLIVQKEMVALLCFVHNGLAKKSLNVR